MPSLICVFAGCIYHFFWFCRAPAQTIFDSLIKRKSLPCPKLINNIQNGFKILNIFSSPEPSGSQGELIVYPYSGVRCRRRRRHRCCRRRRRQQCLNIFSSETALPIKARFFMEPPWEGGTKVCINGPGYMTKMAAMPIYGKNL